MSNMKRKKRPQPVKIQEESTTKQNELPSAEQELVKSCKEVLTKVSFVKKPLLVFVLIYTIAFSSIFRANFNYIDDMGRAYSGYKGWEGFSRYLSNYLSTLIHGGNFLSEISPLPQLIAVLFLAFSSIITVYVITGKKQFSWWEMIAVLPLGLSPYFLECISYKFDAPYMALSILVSVLPFLFRRQSAFVYGAVVFTCTLAMCSTYQAASGIFPMLAVLLCFKQWNEGEQWKKSLKFLALSALSYGLGIVIFQGLLMKPANDYVSNSLPAPSALFPTVYANFKKYFSLVKSDFPILWLILIILLAAYFLYAALRSSVQKPFLSLPIAAIALAVLCLLPFGLYPLLTKPLFATRAMYGFGALIAFLAVFDVSIPKVYFSKLVSLVLSWVFVVFAFAFGNALAVQKEYTDFRMEMVIDAMNTLPVFSTDNTKTVQISGSIGHAPAIQHAIQHYPVLGRLTPVMFTQNWAWGRYRFSYYYGLKNISPTLNLGIDYELPVLTDTMYFTIRGDDQYILIQLK